MDKLLDTINKSYPTVAPKIYKRKVRLRTRVKVWIYNTIVVRFFGDYIQEDINEYVCDNIHDFDHTEVWSDRD